MVLGHGSVHPASPLLLSSFVERGKDLDFTVLFPSPRKPERG
jgi:hypothetical protein